ncbi:DUF2267 domain-containing protein [Nocardia sp. NPDC059239]|uniref:DUF2267 domain-containing protein n=1 Tax=unclassified Nocardia TaxID=2637762 RepID=UPI0036C55BB2
MDTNASTSRPVVRPDDMRQRAANRAVAAEHLRSEILHNASAAELRETHTGLVVLFGDRAYKVKKPIVTDFLDFATTEAREHALRRELELNRRWAPDVYLGLAHLTGPVDGPGEPVLIMRRMPESRRLSRLVASGEIDRAELSELATVMARFHRSAVRSSTIDQAGTAQALRQRWRILLRGPRSHPLSALDPLLVDRIERLAMRFLDGRAPLLAERIADGRILDGHGDLLTEDIFALPDGFRILDCLDFDDSLRAVDGLDDAAFLAMDLEFLGRPQLAEDFLTDYLRAAGDSPPASLRHHYIAYRAMVRAKTNHIRAAQGDEQFVGHAIRHLDLAVRHLEAGAVRLALVGGLPGTGKSTVATRLAQVTGAEVISSDTVRARLRASGAITGARGVFDAGAYRPDARSLVYTHMLEMARQRLGLGISVILDASWIDAAERARAQALAAGAHAELISLRCECPPRTSDTRIRTRRAGDSEATPEIAHALATTSSPWPDATTVDTTTSMDATIAQALRGWNQTCQLSAFSSPERTCPMSHHTDPFARSVHTAHEWLAAVADAMGTEDRFLAHRALRAWLHTVRDRLGVNAAAHLSAQLPELLRGTFYEGWIPAHVPVPRDVPSFLAQFAHAAGVTSEEAVPLVGVVTDALADLFSPGQLDHVLAQLPAALRFLLLGTDLAAVYGGAAVPTQPGPMQTDDIERRLTALTEAVTALVRGLEYPADAGPDEHGGFSAAQQAHRILLAQGLTGAEH